MSIHFKNFRFVHHKEKFYKPMHTHDVYELVYYVSGTGELTCEGQTYPYKSGTIHFSAPGAVHDECNFGESKIFNLYFDMSSDIIPTGVYFDNSGAILTLMRFLKSEMQENLPYTAEICNSLLTQIVFLLKLKLFPKPSENKSFYDVIRYVDENFQFNVDFKSIAEKSCYSYDRFRHIFKEHTGLSPQKYLINKRIDLAKFLIEIDPNVSLTRLAKECGYSSLSKFSNAFLSNTNLTLSQYKNKFK